VDVYILGYCSCLGVLEEGMKEIKKMGRPRAYLTPQDMNKRLQEYFDQWKAEGRPYTMAMLVSYLDITDDTFGEYSSGKYDDQEYENGVTFYETIKKARKFVEGNKIEDALMNKTNATVTIFDLKNNHGYSDKVETKTYDMTAKVIHDNIPNDGLN